MNDYYDTLDFSFKVNARKYSNEETMGDCIYCHATVMKRNWFRHLHKRKQFECGLLHNILQAQKKGLINRDVLQKISIYHLNSKKF